MRIILGLLLLTVARGAAADDAAATPSTLTAAATPSTLTAATTPSTLTAATSARATSQSVNATKQVAKNQTASTKAGDGKADPQAAAGPAEQPGGDVKMSGMSILGNEDAPKSLVLVPWKSSQLADMPSVSRLLDSATQPVDKDVFMRELSYYEFKSGSK
jgi:hypothetical protein